MQVLRLHEFLKHIEHDMLGVLNILLLAVKGGYHLPGKSLELKSAMTGVLTI